MGQAFTEVQPQACHTQAMNYHKFIQYMIAIWETVLLLAHVQTNFLLLFQKILGMEDLPLLISEVEVVVEDIVVGEEEVEVVVEDIVAEGEEVTEDVEEEVPIGLGNKKIIMFVFEL